MLAICWCKSQICIKCECGPSLTSRRLASCVPDKPVEVTWDALPGRVWKGTLETLPTTVVQHGTRTVGEVTCVIENDDLKLLPNTNVSVAVVTARQENALTVPREAIHQDAAGAICFPSSEWRIEDGAM